MTPLIVETEAGLYCPAGDFHIDPQRGVPRAVITHAHTDHARRGSQQYLTSDAGLHVLRQRLGRGVSIRTLPYGERLAIGEVQVSLHPAGHVLGSAQVRVEHRGRVAVVSGDYKTHADPTCAPLEVVRCHEFFSEATFGQPVYRWPPAEAVLAEINAWWRENQAAGRTSVIFAYALGKAQRLIASVDASIGPIAVHAKIADLLPAYAASGVQLPAAQRLEAAFIRACRGRALVLAPPSARGARWLPKFGEYATASASGWALTRGTWGRPAGDRGFVLSDHADWDGLLATIRATGAERVGLMHGQAPSLIRLLRREGVDAYTVGDGSARRDVAPLLFDPLTGEAR